MELDLSTVYSLCSQLYLKLNGVILSDSRVLRDLDTAMSMESQTGFDWNITMFTTETGSKLH